MSENDVSGTRSLFDQLVDLPPAERADRLADVEDEERRREVASLLDAVDPSDRTFAALEDLHTLLSESGSERPVSPLDAARLVGQTVGHYEVEALIGSGGMGVVYRARDTQLERSVALKFLPPHLAADADVKRRFVREARVASRLDHPNICTIHQIGETEDGLPFIAMRHYEGDTLKEKIDAARVSIDDAVSYGVQVADALAEAHEEGIVHRDVKPANVIEARDGQVAILDFGLARLVDTTLTRTGGAPGTVAYMSPEQVRGDEPSPEMDLWAVGVLLYELLTGQRPFSGSTPATVIYSILNESPLPLQHVRPDVPPALPDVVMRLLRKDPDERYQEAGAVSAVLRRVEDGTAPRETHARRERRRPALPRVGWRRAVGGGLGVLVMLLVFWAYVHNIPIGTDQMDRVGGVPDIHSVAVLPLVNVSGTDDQAYLASGMTEALINRLGQLATLTVISRTSVARYRKTEKSVRQIAGELGVDAVVEGSVMRVGSRIRITAQLVDASTEQQVWAGSYDEELRNALALQNDVARAVATQIQDTLTPEQETRLARFRHVDPAVYEAYLKGMFHLNTFTASGFDTGLSYLRDAIDADPDDPLPHAGLAHGYSLVAHNSLSPPPDAFQKAKAAAWAALERDPSLATAHAVIGEVSLYRDWDLDRAERSFRRALVLNPNLASAHAHYGWSLMAVGRSGDATAHMKRAQELDPLVPIYSAWMGWIYATTGRTDRAIDEAKNALELDPDFSWGLHVLGLAHAATGRHDEAISVHRRLAQVSPPLRWSLACSYAHAGENAEARAIASELEREDPTPIQMWGLARIYAALGNTEKAIDWLEAAYDARLSWMPWIGRYPSFRELRGDPQFQNLVQRVHGTAD